MKPWQNPSRRPESEEETFRLLREICRFREKLQAARNELAREFGLTDARWLVLDTVEDKARTTSSIGRFLGLTRQSVQRTVRHLAGDGFVTLGHNPDHARARLVTISEKGALALGKLRKKQADWVSGLAGNMEPGNIRMITGTLRGLISRIEKPEKKDT